MNIIDPLRSSYDRRRERRRHHELEDYIRLLENTFEITRPGMTRGAFFVYLREVYERRYPEGTVIPDARPGIDSEKVN